MTPKTVRPDMAGLSVVINATNILHGERHGPELPIPVSAIQKFADRHKLSNVFVTLVQAYDSGLLAGLNKQATELFNNDGKTKAKTSTKKGF